MAKEHRFDAIVVGAGAAGCVVVRRLAESGDRTDDLRRRVLENAYSIPHVVGTCAMGPSPEDGAVVDSLGRVHGVDGLSIIDASIIPDAPSGFPHLVTIMLAERLAEQLR